MPLSGHFVQSSKSSVHLMGCGSVFRLSSSRLLPRPVFVEYLSVHQPGFDNLVDGFPVDRPLLRRAWQFWTFSGCRGHFQIPPCILIAYRPVFHQIFLHFQNSPVNGMRRSTLWLVYQSCQKLWSSIPLRGAIAFWLLFPCCWHSPAVPFGSF